MLRTLRPIAMIVTFFIIASLSPVRLGMPSLFGLSSGIVLAIATDLEEQARQGEAERQRQQAEAERLRQAEAERLKQAEVERLRQAEAEQKKQAELERLKQAEAEQKKQAELERLKQAEAEQKKQAELERLKQAEAERLRQAEAERLRQAEAERLKTQRKTETGSEKRGLVNIKAENVSKRERVPLPPDVLIVQPEEGTPAEYAEFIGKWSGKWNNDCPLTIIVEEVNKLGNATIVFAQGSWPWFGKGRSPNHPLWERLRAQFLGSKLVFSRANRSLLFDALIVDNSGSMRVSRTDTRRKNYYIVIAKLTKVE